MKRLITTLVALGVALALATPATAAVPPPTVGAYWEQTEAGLGRPAPPLLTAAWIVAKPGHDASLSVDGPALGWSVTVEALWTSDLLTVRKAGATLAHLDLTWDATQFDPTPKTHDSSLAITARFSDAKGRWGDWNKVAQLPLTSSPEQAQTGVQKASLDAHFVGALPKGKIRMQVKLLDNLIDCYIKQQLVRITA